ncbi:ppsD, partial [Symbiodinium sp. CCMP2456]
MLSVQGESLVGRLVNVTGDHEVVEGAVAAEASIKGQVVRWAPEEQYCMVRSFGGAFVRARPASLAEMEEEFDVLWPEGDNLRLLGKEVAECLAKKMHCLVQCFASYEVGLRATEMARKRLGWRRFPKELEPSYLGQNAQGKILWLPADDPRREVQSPLESCDRLLSKLASGLYVECQDTLGFLPDGRSDALLWLPPKSHKEEEANLRQQERLTEEHVRDGQIEGHIDFVQSRKVCALYQVAGSANVVLHSAEGVPIHVALRSGQVLVFRHDLLTFSHEGSIDSLAMLTWIFSTGYAAEVQQLAGIIGKEADVASGVISGPLSPVNPVTGKTVSVMSADCMLAGNGVSPEEYWQMLAMGTDGCRHLSPLRWDPEVYFEPDKDIAFGKYYSNHGGFVVEDYFLGFDAAFFGFTDEQAAMMDPIQRNTLEVGYSTLLKAGWNRKRLGNANVGVYIGNCGTDWSGMKLILPSDLPSMSAEMVAFRLSAMSAHSTSTRLSYIFGMTGPISTSDTACSSSLVATGEAHNALRQLDPGQKNITSSSGSTEHALAMGTNGLLGPFSWIGLCGPKMLSAKGRCFTFDYGADGFGRGEGTSGIFMQVTHEEPTERLAIFCGTNINQDG